MQSKVYIYIAVLVHWVAIASNQLPQPSTPLISPSLRMVNYHDPDVVLQDACAYAFAARYMGSESQLTSSDRGSDENLACSGWTLLVCLHRRALDYSHNISNNNNLVLILAGSLLPLSISNGVSSEGIALTDGQYGYVAMCSLY
jgi:hypothetical protein